MIDETATQVVASTASVWEVAIKWSLRKGSLDDMPLSGRDFVAALDAAGIEVLPIRPSHAAQLDDLPNLHRDPFDRLLLATAQVEGLTLLTRDTQLGAYGSAVVLV